MLALCIPRKQRCVRNQSFKELLVGSCGAGYGGRTCTLAKTLKHSASAYSFWVTTEHHPPALLIRKGAREENKLNFSNIHFYEEFLPITSARKIHTTWKKKQKSGTIPLNAMELLQIHKWLWRVKVHSGGPREIFWHMFHILQTRKFDVLACGELLALQTYIAPLTYWWTSLSLKEEKILKVSNTT